MPHIRVDTAIGDFQIKLFTDQAPHTCQYFLNTTMRRQFDRGQIFRITHTDNDSGDLTPAIQVIQLGTAKATDQPRELIEHEATHQTGLRHKRWTVSASRFGVGEVYASMFICLRDEPELDHGGARHPDGLGYAAFGEIASGTDTLRQIYAQPHRGELLTPPLLIESAIIVNTR